MALGDTTLPLGEDSGPRGELAVLEGLDTSGNWCCDGGDEDRANGLTITLLLLLLSL